MAKPSLLYVDDEHQNLVAFKASFRKQYEVHTAQSGAEALALLRETPVQVIVADQRMPGMTGVELFEQLLPEFPDPIRMVLTGYSDVQAIVDAINKGQIYYYITKPWRHEELAMVLQKGFEAYRFQTENRDLQAEKQQLQLEAERQQKANLLSQFETLKNQVNPHFLFNSLNVLLDLIHEDPDLAEDFIVKLTRVYRYVLELTDRDTVELAEELNFVKNYLFLHQIRFGNSLQLYSQVPEDRQQEHLPPLTLQLLVENAIKHNVISREQPMTIELSVTDHWFVVRNSYQPRQDEVPSTGIGLANLRQRYAYLEGPAPHFGIEGSQYVAKVPLLVRER
jgi:sensor histidine kinase YesM